MKILITGASSGIGESAALHLKKIGWQITGLDKNKSKNKFDYHNIDLNDLNSVSKFIDEIDFDFDAMLYAAGTREICDPLSLSLEIWQSTININLTSAFLLSQACIKNAIQKKRKFNLVFISSISGIQAEPNRAAYVSSKFALHGLTKQLALQYGQYQVRVNSIAPGIIETPLTEHYFKDPSKIELIKKATPVGYWGKPEHIMSILDLCLNNDYMNGSIIVCDGGWTAGKDL